MSPSDETPPGRADVLGRAVHGALWATALGWGSRAVTLGATIALTFFLDRAELGEVSTAAILVASANQLSMLGVPNYLATREKLSGETRWAAVLLLSGLGAVALLLVIVLGAPLAHRLGAPAIAPYLPWLSVSSYLTRLSTVPEVLLQRRMRFREASAAKAAGDIAYAISAVALAAAGFGGNAVVWSNVVRSASVLVLLSARLSPRSWLAPPLASTDASNQALRKSVRSILGFGLPMTVGLAGNIIVRQWDNLLMLAQFGVATVGAYNQSYNLADVPATQVTEQLGDVMAPSFAKLDAAQKKAALVRLLAALSVVVYPLAAGLSVVAPTFVALLRHEWGPMAPLLTVLALLALARPLGWTLSVYFQTTGRPRTVMWLMLLLIALLFPTMFALGRAFGPEGACAGVVIAFFAHALASMIVIARRDAVPLGRMLAGPTRALFALVPLVLCVLGVRAGLARAGVHAAGLRLALEIAAGVIGYGVGLRLFAMGILRDMRETLRQARRARTEGQETSEATLSLEEEPLRNCTGGAS